MSGIAGPLPSAGRHVRPPPARMRGIGESQREVDVPGVLEGIRVLDFGRYIAGPFCAALLADFGAEVIRIERLGGGEDRPFIPVGAPPEGGGAMFLAMNRNKLGMTLDPA